MPVICSLEDDEHIRCVDLLLNDDGSFSFKEFRRDPEAQGIWTLVADYSALKASSMEDALAMAERTVGWLKPMR